MIDQADLHGGSLRSTAGTSPHGVCPTTTRRMPCWRNQRMDDDDVVADEDPAAAAQAAATAAAVTAPPTDEFTSRGWLAVLTRAWAVADPHHTSAHLALHLALARLMVSWAATSPAPFVSVPPPALPADNHKGTDADTPEDAAMATTLACVAHVTHTITRVFGNDILLVTSASN